jgi:hypothetical protein
MASARLIGEFLSRFSIDRFIKVHPTYCRNYKINRISVLRIADQLQFLEAAKTLSIIINIT